MYAPTAVMYIQLTTELNNMKTIINCLKNIAIRIANATYTTWCSSLAEKYMIAYLGKQLSKLFAKFRTKGTKK